MNAIQSNWSKTFLPGDLIGPKFENRAFKESEGTWKHQY